MEDWERVIVAGELASENVSEKAKPMAVTQDGINLNRIRMVGIIIQELVCCAQNATIHT